jgi:hypothetical protein
MAPGLLGFLLNTNLLPSNAAKVMQVSFGEGNPLPLRNVRPCDQMIAATLKTVIVRYLRRGRHAVQRTQSG